MGVDDIDFLENLRLPTFFGYSGEIVATKMARPFEAWVLLCLCICILQDGGGRPELGESVWCNKEACIGVKGK